MAGLRFLGRTAPRHPGGGSGSAFGDPPSLGAGRGFETRVAPTIKTLLEGGKHIAILGATGCGKTTLAKVLCSLVPRPLIIDWDGEYDLGLPVMEPPFLLPLSAPKLRALISNLERPREGGHGIALSLHMVGWEPQERDSEELSLKDLYAALRSYVLQGAPYWAHAALARLEVLLKYFVHVQGEGGYNAPLRFNLEPIEDVRERAIIQQALATATVLSRPLNPPDEILLVIEEGGMGATAEYLKDLIVLARRRGVKVVYVSQIPPPEELLNSFTLILGDPGPLRHEWSRLLGLPLPHLRRGEFLLYDGNTVRRIKVKP